MKRRDRRVNLKQELKDAIFWEFIEEQIQDEKEASEDFMAGIDLCLRVIEKVLNDYDS